VEVDRSGMATVSHVVFFLISLDLAF